MTACSALTHVEERTSFDVWSLPLLSVQEAPPAELEYNTGDDEELIYAFQINK